MKKRLLALLLSLSLILSVSVLSAAALSLEDAKQLLEDYYVDGVSDEILAMDSLDEILAAIGDPYTYYMTAEEYEQFLSSVNGESLVGIGISIQRIFDDGYLIMSILPNSPALEAGLTPGDRIIAVDGISLSAEMDVTALIAGEDGTTVTVTVIHQANGRQRDYIMVRRAVHIPIVTYGTVGQAGIIDCISFGDTTVETIEEALSALNSHVSIWIMDLRSNPGGTSEAAAGSAGLFVGSQTMVYFRDSSGSYDYLYTLPTCPDLTDKPLIVLTSPYSASGAELFAAAARDYSFGIGIGQRSFGKGIAQIVLDDTNTWGLFDGDAMKITVYRFYSPSGATNHTVGVIPTLMISEENASAAALLLSEPAPASSTGFLKLELVDQTFYMNIETAVNAENADAFTELLEALPPSAILSRGSAGKNWTASSPAQLAEQLALNYMPRSFPDISGTQFEDEINTLRVYQLLGGYQDGTFRPDNTITRAEFCAMTASALNLSPSERPLSFSDTSANAWYSPAVSAMSSLGFVSGYDDGTFRPDSTITYQEMVTVLSAVAGWTSMDGYSMSKKEQVPAGEWLNYQAFSQWAQVPAWTLDSLNALVGDLAPTDNCTREVAAGTLCSVLEGIHLLWN